MANIGTAYVRIAPNMTGIQGKIASGFRGTGNAVAGQFQSELSAKSAAIAGAVAGVAAAAVNKAMNLVGNSIGDAISRVDTLARFPTVMKNLGFSAEDASLQVNRIAKELIGLPTSLDSLVTFVQRVSPVSKSLAEATDLALAFNNAVLAGGGPTYRQADAIEQFSQMLAKGKPDMMAWRTLQEAMPATLGQIAKQLGITSGNTLDLYDALQDGKIGFDDFTDAVVSLNTKGLPGFKNFEAQAKDATAGIATGIQNAQTAITRGLAKILQSIGQKNISGAIANIGKAFESVLTVIANNLPKAISIISSFVSFIIKYKDIFVPIAVGITAALVALKAWTTYLAVSKAALAIYTATTAYFNLVNSLMAQGLSLSRAAMMGLNIAMSANPIGIIIALIVALVAGLAYFFTQTETGRKIFAAAFNGMKTVVAGLVNWIKANWPLLLAILTGPIGIAVGLIVRNFGTIKAAFSNAYGFVTGLWGKISGFFSNIFSNIKNAFSGMRGVGMDIVKGLWHGIQDMGGWLKDKVIRFVKDKIPGPVKKALGISSPSKVAAALGREVPRGLAKGIEQTSGIVGKAADNMANQAIVGMTSPVVDPSMAFRSSAVGSPLGNSSNTTNQQVSIQKIVLASEGAVKQFFKELNQDTISVGMGITPNQGAEA